MKTVDSIDLLEKIMNKAKKGIKNISKNKIENLDHQPSIYNTFSFEKYDIQVIVKLIKK